MANIQLIDAPTGVIEVESLWQQDNPQDPDTKAVALLCHPHPLFQGTMTNKVVSTMFRFARDNGMHVVRFNFRGVGQSTGEHDYGKGEVVDAMTVLQWVASQTSARQVWLGGFSFGGYITAKVAENLLINAHVWGLDELEILKVALIAPSVVNYDVSDLALPTKRSFMIYGDEDEVIDPQSMQAFAERMDIEVSVVAGASHFFHGRLGELKELLTKHTF